MSTIGSKPFSRIAVIGVGEVGGAAAFALIISSIARELLLVDINTTLRDGQVRDLSDVAYSSNSVTRVRAATHHEAGQCDIVVITAGSKSVLGMKFPFLPNLHAPDVDPRPQASRTSSAYTAMCPSYET